MAIVDLILPALGEGIQEATIIKWHKKPGDQVKEDETVLDIATDKVDSEVPSTAEGTISEILYKENEVAPVGGVIARIETNGASEPATAAEQKPSHTDIPIPAGPESERDKQLIAGIPYIPPATEQQVPQQEATAATATGANNGFYSPLVINIARTEGIPLSDLEKIKGTAKDGRLSKNDLLNYIEARKHQHHSDSVSTGNITTPPAPEKPTPVKETLTPAPAVSLPETNTGTGLNQEVIEMDRMRKLIARNMKESQNISATVTSFEEADVTNIVKWRNRIKSAFEKQEGTKITFTPIFIDCVVRVLRRYPLINSSIDGDHIILKKDINIGMATALPSGNLIVPVIKNAAYLNLAGLTRAVNTLADNSRHNRLKPSDTQDGTFTVTNVGSFGSLTGTPIINQPQVAILAIGTIKKRPVVIETPTGDTIGIRNMMLLSLSYDHRLVDGALGSTFLHEIVKEMEGWDINKEI